MTSLGSFRTDTRWAPQLRLILVSAALYVVAMHVSYGAQMHPSGPSSERFRSVSFLGVPAVYAASVAYAAWRSEGWLLAALGAVPAGLVLGLTVALVTLGPVWNQTPEMAIHAVTLTAMPIVIVAPLSVMIAGAARVLCAHDGTPPDTQ